MVCSGRNPLTPRCAMTITGDRGAGLVIVDSFAADWPYAGAQAAATPISTAPAIAAPLRDKPLKCLMRKTISIQRVTAPYTPLTATMHRRDDSIASDPTSGSG